jgi:hypothetical protein
VCVCVCVCVDEAPCEMSRSGRAGVGVKDAARARACEILSHMMSSMYRTESRHRRTVGRLWIARRVKGGSGARAIGKGAALATAGRRWPPLRAHKPKAAGPL